MSNAERKNIDSAIIPLKDGQRHNAYIVSHWWSQVSINVNVTIIIINMLFYSFERCDSLREYM